MESDSDESFLCIPEEIVKAASTATLNLLPEKSKGQYLKEYDLFIKWRVEKQVCSFTERVLLAYFEEKSKQWKSPTLGYKKEGRNIVYIDEMYIHSSHTQEKGWTDKTLKELQKPIGKGKRLIIVHAGGKSGFVPNALLIFPSGSKSGDYHHDMNYENFSKWLETQVLPNLPLRSVLLVNNALYHNVKLLQMPVSSTRKEEMIRWLQDKNIKHDPSLTKPELYKIIKQNKSKNIPYKIDHLVEQYGHVILRLPPYHLEFNPIEKIWALKEHLLDNAFDRLAFTVNTGESDESAFDESEDSSYEENDDIDG
ncbi:hypothetical protein ILUMI_07612, partial [Ignelater luminosus]